MNDVRDVLSALGYEKIQPAGGDWKPLAEVNGTYGTTDDTNVLWHQDEGEMELVDAETGELRAFARKHEPTPQTNDDL